MTLRGRRRGRLYSTEMACGLTLQSLLACIRDPCLQASINVAHLSFLPLVTFPALPAATIGYVKLLLSL